ncbi:DNA polymerase V [Propionibacterium cyclohexanicum]|uniref:DNA polymerase V n=1 Tax=Propionibacterium cyclohexanicum TaxID=64702 RepID=A0A1H9TK73_9ACTN|nr:hypothetical protein [Propionibacterium cyclohexanicum]SER97541.1 DNA polymerase V [Propionibacterium cyclohexanicum]
MCTTAQAIRTRVRHDLGIPVSEGTAPTCTLAELASHGAKHTTALCGGRQGRMPSRRQASMPSCTRLPSAACWAWGRLTERLAALQITTARELRDTHPVAMRKRFSVTVERRGQVMFSRSFSTPVTSTDAMHQVFFDLRPERHPPAKTAEVRGR